MAESDSYTSSTAPRVWISGGGLRRVSLDELQTVPVRLEGTERGYGKVYLYKNSRYWKIAVYNVPITDKDGNIKRVSKARECLFLPFSKYRKMEAAMRALTHNPFIMYHTFKDIIPHLGPYDGVWFPGPKNFSYMNADRTVHQGIHFMFRRAEYVKPKDYRYTLFTEDNPLLFIRTAKQFSSANIENTREFEFKFIIPEFRKILIADSLKKVKHVLEESKYEDLTDLLASYRTLLNKTLPQLKTEIQSARRCTLDISTFPPNKYSVWDRVNTDRVTFQRDLTTDCKKELEKVRREATAVITANINQLEGQIITLEDPDAPFERHPDMEDPANNPYLVFDPIASKEKGEVVYINVAKNKNVTYRTIPKYSTDPYSRHTLETMLKTPEFREKHRAIIDPDTGKPFGGAEGDDEEEPSVLPWVAGGILAAYGISQAI